MLQKFKFKHNQKPDWCIENPSLNPERAKIIVDSWKKLQQGTTSRWIKLQKSIKSPDSLSSSRRKIKTNSSSSLKFENRSRRTRSLSSEKSKFSDTDNISLPSLHLRSRKAYFDSLKVVAEDQEMAKEKTESINSPEISIDKEKVIHAPVLQNSPKEASLTKSVKNLARIISAKLKQTKKEKGPKPNYNSAIQEFYSEFFNRLFKENREMERLFEDFNMEKHGKMFAEQIDQLILLVQKLSNSEIKSSIQKSIEFFKSKGMSRRILIQGSAIFMQTLCLLLDEPDSISDEQTTIAWIHLVSMILDIALPALTDISKKKKKHQSRIHSFSDNNSLRSHSASLLST